MPLGRNDAEGLHPVAGQALDQVAALHHQWLESGSPDAPWALRDLAKALRQAAADIQADAAELARAA